MKETKTSEPVQSELERRSGEKKLLTRLSTRRTTAKIRDGKSEMRRGLPLNWIRWIFLSLDRFASFRPKHVNKASEVTVGQFIEEVKRATDLALKTLEDYSRAFRKIDSLIPMIFEFAQKSFPTQYLLPFYRFERILDLTCQPLFHPATILPSLPAPAGLGLENPLNRLDVQERFPFLQAGATPVAAPTVLSQTFPALHCLSRSRRTELRLR
jgi:hypothetical protein